MSNALTPLDLPEKVETSPVESEKDIVSVVIWKNGSYSIDDVSYELAELGAACQSKIDNYQNGLPKVKISGHRDARYEAVFNVLALCQANEWDPVLAYSK